MDLNWAAHMLGPGEEQSAVPNQSASGVPNQAEQNQEADEHIKEQQAEVAQPPGNVAYSELSLQHHCKHHPPVKIKGLRLLSQLLQGNAGVGPEGHVRYESHQLVQLALQLLDDGHVVCLLLEGRLQLDQVLLHRLV